MARPAAKQEAEELEVEITVMRKVAPERFEVFVASVTGSLTVKKVLEKSVSLVVGREAAQKSMRKQHDSHVAKLGLTVIS